MQENKDCYLRVRVTKEMNDKLIERAASADLTKSDIVRQALIEYLK